MAAETSEASARVRGSEKVRLRLALAQINPTVGALSENAALILESAQIAAQQEAQVLLFPEMALTGYPIEDLALRNTFQQASRNALKNLAAKLEEVGCGQILTLVGYLDTSEDRRPQNALAAIYRGEVVARYVKQHLPNYGVFDEFRHFAPGRNSTVIRFNGVDIGLAICEDIWESEGAMSELAARKPGLVLVPNGSPFEKGKFEVRINLVKKRAAQLNAPVAYLNLVGGQDDLIFDGGSVIVEPNGNILGASPQFQEGVMAIDLLLSPGTAQPNVIISEELFMEQGPREIAGGSEKTRLDNLAQVWMVLQIGLRDYIKKNNFSTVALGLSGGIDSALVATLAVDALGRDKVFGYALPSKYSSDHSLNDAKELAINLGIGYKVLPIENMVESFVSNLNLSGLAEENVQARVRGTTLMAISNQTGALVLATGNKSELAVGYSTLYGDAVGAYAPIKDIFKVEVWALAKWRNQQARLRGEVPPIPESSITKEPSAELRPGQKDSDSLPDYDQLDKALAIYIDDDLGLAGLLAAGFSRDFAKRIINLVDRAEYKRRQYPPGPKVSVRAFGKDRRLPITSTFREE
jgi:NAD+ synthase (glutamine-hydrolysing)